MKRIVGISGNASRPSKTFTLVNLVVDSLSAGEGGERRAFDLAGVLPTLGSTLSRSQAAGPLDTMLSAIETCDVLVVGSPTYKASYAGLLKHLFDLLDMKVLDARVVVACATGRASAHGPKVEQHFRMLFEFFGARMAPGFVFGLDGDFTPDGAPTEELKRRVDVASRDVLAMIPAGSNLS